MDGGAAPELCVFLSKGRPLTLKKLPQQINTRLRVSFYCNLKQNEHESASEESIHEGGLMAFD